MRRMQISRTRILLVAIFCASLGTGCSGGGEAKPAAQLRKPIDPTAKVLQTLTLPNDDGRVHILLIPGRYESARCLVHVSPNGLATMHCPPAAEVSSRDLDVHQER